MRHLTPLRIPAEVTMVTFGSALSSRLSGSEGSMAVWSENLVCVVPGLLNDSSPEAPALPQKLASMISTTSS